MTTAAVTVTDEDISAALQLVGELERGGRATEADAVLRLLQAEIARRDAQYGDLSAEDAEVLARADHATAAGKLIPHEIVLQGHDAVEAYLRNRERRGLDSEATAVRDEFRRQRDAERTGTA
ncbi:MAG: hypothetical protein HY332_06115 [Chloroflexi bacterium]|nr:hypothetical protein [Chloroflexota bacterium]